MVNNTADWWTMTVKNRNSWLIFMVARRVLDYECEWRPLASNTGVDTHIRFHRFQHMPIINMLAFLNLRKLPWLLWTSNDIYKCCTLAAKSPAFRIDPGACQTHGRVFHISGRAPHAHYVRHSHPLELVFQNGSCDLRLQLMHMMSVMRNRVRERLLPEVMPELWPSHDVSHVDLAARTFLSAETPKNGMELRR